MTLRKTDLAPGGEIYPGAEAVGLSEKAAAFRRRGVLFVVGCLDLGGSESQVVLLAEELVRRGWKVQVFSLKRGGVLGERLRAAGVPVISGIQIRSRRGDPSERLNAAAQPALPGGAVAPRTMLMLIGAQLRLVWQVLHTRPAVVHAVLPLTNFVGALAGRIGWAPLVITSRRGLGNHQDRRRWARVIDRYSNSLSDVVVANSRAVAEDTARRDAYELERIRVIPNGLQFERFSLAEPARAQLRQTLGLAETDIGIVCVANLIPYKGHLDLVRAFAKIASAHPQAALYLVGEDRGIAETLMQEAARLGIERRTRLLGQRTDVPAILAAMDVGVVASHEEGFSNALLEKLAAGLPVVATRVGGNPEAVEDMPDCVLVEPQQPESLAQGLMEIIQRLPQTLNNRAVRRERVRQRYSVGAMVESYERLYLGDPGGP